MTDNILKHKKELQKGPFLIIDSQEKYNKNGLIVKEEKIIKPDETDGIEITVEAPSQVAILVLNKNRELFLIREFSYPLNDYSIHIPHGDNSEESATDSAKKYLLEKTGIEAKTWIDLGTIHSSTQFIDSKINLFLAEDIITFNESTNTDIIKVSLDHAYQMAMEGKITNAASIIAIFRAKIKVTTQE